MPEEVRAEIVRRLACYETPAAVLRWLKEETNEDVTIQAIVCYDPTRYAGRELSEKWRVLFEASRKAYLTSVETVPLANQGYRLAQMQTMFDEAIKAKNRGQALQIMEQAAKEMGGVYSNVRTLNTPDMAGGGDQIPQHERAQKLASIIDGALGSLKNVTPLPAK